MVITIKEEHDFSKLLINVIYDEIIFENVNFAYFVKSLPILESFGYKTIVFDNCENIHLFTNIFFSVMFEKVIFKNCIIDNSNRFLTETKQKTSNNSIKQIEFYNTIMVGGNITIKHIERLKFINYEVDEKYYYALLNNMTNTLSIKFNGFGSSTATNKTEIIVNKSNYFSEKFLYKILNISHNVVIYFEDGKELTEEYIDKVVKARIRKEKISNLLNER